MSLEENKTIVRRFIEAINTRNLALLNELISPDFIYQPHQIQGLDRIKHIIEEEITGFPDYHAIIEDIIAEGNKVWARVTYEGTHTGDYLGFPPTGKKISYKSVTIKRVVDGKMVEGWTVNDMLDFFRQIGLIETTEQGKKLFPETAS